jgi:circadian clock protein KaiB
LKIAEDLDVENVEIESPAVWDDPADSRYVLRLYVTGKTPSSLRAIANVKEVCEQYLPGRYQLLVIDIYQQPVLAEEDQILVAPTLVKRAPGPPRKLIGDLSDRDRILKGLGLWPGPEASTED